MDKEKELIEKAYQACEWLEGLMQDGTSIVYETKIDAGNISRRQVVVEDSVRDQIRALRDEFKRLETGYRVGQKATVAEPPAPKKPVAKTLKPPARPPLNPRRPGRK